MTEENVIVEEREEQKDKKKLNKKVVIILSAIGIVLAGIYFYIESKYVSTDDAYVETTTVQVSPKISGQIVEVYVEDNQKIKKGDLIARIEDNDYKIKAVQAKARYEQALLNQQNAKANFEATKTQIETAKLDYERYESLYKEGAVSKQELDRAKTNYENTKARLTNSNQALISNEGKNVADAEIAELKALMNQAELYLSYTNIYAPQTGTVAGKKVMAGMMTQPGTPLLTIVPEHVWIVANFKENQLKHMKAGQDVQIKVDTFGNKKFSGVVDSIQRASGAKSSMFPPENAVGSFVKIVQRIPVKIEFTNLTPDEMAVIIPGMSVVPKVKVK